jgi:hypothetical protein
VQPGSPWIAPPANHATHVGDDDPAVPSTHVFDACGNLVRETTSRHFQWDHRDRLRAFRTQAAASEPSIHVQYFYDTSGQRVMKLARHQGAASRRRCTWMGFTSTVHGSRPPSRRRTPFFT